MVSFFKYINGTKKVWHNICIQYIVYLSRIPGNIIDIDITISRYRMIYNAFYINR